jgi:multiple sugar transport system permease protein
VGVDAPDFVHNPSWALWTLVLLAVWQFGAPMVIFLAGLKQIPAELYDAASVDGAGWWRRFWSITVPMLSPVILFNLVMGIIFSFQVFTNAFLMTQGGPANTTLFTVLYLYQIAFEQFKIGYASAIAWVLFLVILVFTLIQWKVADYWVHYEGKR